MFHPSLPISEVQRWGVKKNRMSEKSAHRGEILYFIFTFTFQYFSICLCPTWKLIWAGHVALMAQIRNENKILVGKPEKKRPFGRPGYR
jgi:hypothetical protein